MRPNRWLGALIALVFAGSITTGVVAQHAGEVAGAGAAPLPAGTTFNLVSVHGLQFGVGAAVAANTLGTGDLHVTLLGTSALGEPREITYDAKVQGISAGDGTATLTGTGNLDMADGSAPLIGVPFTMTATGNTLLLTIGTNALPQAALTQGAITVN